MNVINATTISIKTRLASTVDTADSIPQIIN